MKAWLNKAWSATKDWLFSRLVGNLDHIDFQSKTVGEDLKASEKGTVTYTLGLLFGRKHVVHLDSKLSEAEVAKQTITLMDLSEPTARAPLDLSRVTNSFFFLGVNNEAAKKMHNLFLRHLNRADVLTQAKLVVAKVHQKLHEIHDDPRQQTRQGRYEIYLENRSVFSEYYEGFHQAVMQSLFGFNVPQYLIASLKDAAMNYIPLSLLPEKIRYLTPQLRKISREFDAAVIRFLNEYLPDLAFDEDYASNKNIFTDIIVARFPEVLQLGSLNHDQIQSLCQDQDIRSCLTLILAVDNLEKVMTCAFVQLRLRPEGKDLTRTIFEKYGSIDNIQSLQDLSQDACPELHALLLESLRFERPAPLVRYTQKGIHNEVLDIPARSLVIFQYPTHRYRSSDEFPGNEMHYQRFLTEPRQRDLHTPLFTTFGVGGRMCPATSFAISLAKMFIAAHCIEIESVSPGQSDVVFRKP